VADDRARMFEDLLSVQQECFRHLFT